MEIRAGNSGLSKFIQGDNGTSKELGLSHMS